MNKEKITRLVIVSIIAIIMYINFVTIYYSIDTPLIIQSGYDNYAINYSLYDGRIFMSGICLLSNYINVPISIFYFICVITALMISSFCVLKIYDIIQTIKPTTNKLIKFLLFLISYTYIFNFMYTDSMQFIESIIIAISIYLYIIASEKLIMKRKKIQSLILVVIAVFFYQGTINVFISFVCFLAILKHKKINKELIKDIFIAAIITLISVASNILLINIIHRFIEIERISRINTDIIENMQKSIKVMPQLFINSLKLFPKYFFIAFVMLQFIIISIYAIRYKEKYKIFKMLLIIVTYIISSLFLVMVQPNAIHDGNGRIFSSIGALISAMTIYIYCSTEILDNTKWLKKIWIGIICIYFIINFCNTFYLTFEAKSLNIYDKKYSKNLLEKIEKYEEENNIEVTKMAYKYILKENERPALPKTKYTVSMKKVGAYSEYVLKLYTGRILEKIKFDDEIFEKYFSNEKEDIMFIGDTVYFTIEY